MNMRWACTWPLLTTLAITGINFSALGQAPAPAGYPPVAMMPPGAAAYDPAMMAAMQGGPPAGAYSPAAMYMPAAARARSTGTAITACMCGWVQA